MATKKTYSINNIKQLIDLNGDLTNFEVKFEVVSENNQPFDVLVVDQTTLDNNPNIEYKRVNGRISGTVKNDKGVYQNYFLILRSDQPQNCTVELLRNQIEKVRPQLPDVPANDDLSNKESKSSVSWIKVILIVGTVAAGCYLLYWLSQKKGDSDLVNTNDNTNVATEGAGFKFYESSYSPSLQGSMMASSHGSPENPILEKLKNLNL